MSYLPANVDQPTAPPPPRKRRTTLIVVTAILLAGVVAGVIGGISYLDRSDNTTTAQASTQVSTPAAAVTASTPAPTPANCPNGRLPNGDCAGGTVPANRLANDPLAPVVCPKILKAQGTQAIYDPDQMEPIGDQAGNSLDHDLAFAGKMLADRARLARAAKKNNDSDAATYTLNMGTAATELSTVCTKAGFKQ